MTSVIGVVLAAGLSSRMGAANKLTKKWQGKPLVRHVVDAAIASELEGTMVMTGHEAEKVAELRKKRQFRKFPFRGIEFQTNQRREGNHGHALLDFANIDNGVFCPYCA